MNKSTEQQARVNACTDLAGLARTLNAIADEPDGKGLEDVVDICGLPTFGGEPPAYTAGIWSWDTGNLMYYDADGDLGFYVEARAEAER